MSEEEISGGLEGPRPADKDSRGGRRWSNSQMDRAVEAMWRNPALSAEEALRMCSYVFPQSSDNADGKKGIKAWKGVIDSDNVSIAQRKNNLLCRLRPRRNAVLFERIHV